MFGAVGLLMFTNCKKSENNNYTLTAFSEDSTLSNNLFVDGVNKGKLPFVSGGIDDCGDGRALNLSLPKGNYKIQSKDSVGNITASLTLTIAEEATNQTDSGNVLMISYEKCILLGLD
jgi:hypothetical protein